MDETVWKRNEDWVGSEIEDSFVAINVNTGIYVALNVTARAVWRELATPCVQARLEERLRAEFDVAEDDCRRAVSRLLEQMRGLDLASPQ